MISSIKIKNFRGFDEIELNDMTELTLISGKNNSGKSTILEAVFVLLGHARADIFSRLNQFRSAYVGSSSAELWTPYFHNLELNNDIEIAVDTEKNGYVLNYRRDNSYVPSDDIAPKSAVSAFVNEAHQSYSLAFSFRDMNGGEETGNYMVSKAGTLQDIRSNIPQNALIDLPVGMFVNSLILGTEMPLTDWMGKLELQGKKTEIIDVLKLIEPDITDVVTVSLTGVAQLYVKIGGSLLPLKHSGDGINRLLYILLAIIENPGTILLIDEIETGFHYSIYSKLWETIAAAAHRYGCQIIATTHSYECLAGALEGTKTEDRNRRFSFYRIDRAGKVNRAHRYSHSELDYAVASNMEVR